LQIEVAALARVLDFPTRTDVEPLELVTAASKVREGKATKLVLGDPNTAAPTRDTKLVVTETSSPPWP
jgi:hypothetical protein